MHPEHITDGIKKAAEYSRKGYVDKHSKAEDQAELSLSALDAVRTGQAFWSALKELPANTSVCTAQANFRLCDSRYLGYLPRSESEALSGRSCPADVDGMSLGIDFGHNRVYRRKLSHIIWMTIPTI
jgi:hypothetical protein